MAKKNITSRSDLSFTATSDNPGIVSNWNVPHDKGSYWGDTVPIGQRYFAEVEELAAVDEDAAYSAIQFAIEAVEWNHCEGGVGWGIESGFSQELAAAAIVGLRAMRKGAEHYDCQAVTEMADADSSGKDLDHLSEEEYDALANFGPAISDEQIYQLEEAATTRERGQHRRLCLAACARSADDLSELSIESPEAFGEMLECIESFKEHAKGVAALSESAYLRMRVADCRTAEKAA